MRRTGSALLAGALALLLLAALALPAGGATGVDVSNWQHPFGAAIDWNQVRASGRTFAFIKATGGPDYTNPYFRGDWDGAAAAGMYRGAYHYARPALPLSTAVAQARYFVSTTGTMQGAGDLPPVLDLETANGLAPGDVVAWAQTWLVEVQRLTGRTPIVYTGYYFWQDHLGSTSALAGYRLWLPWYTTNPFIVRVAPPWGAWTFWQWSSTGTVPGITTNVDLDNYCCADANLAALGGGSANPAAGNPFGSVDLGAHRQFGTIDVAGWAIDPDSTGPLTVHVYVDGVGAGITTADTTRTDVGGAYPGWGDQHGFQTTVAAGPGAHTVCAYAINTGVGTANTQLGCRVVLSTPIGSLDAVTVTPQGLRVGGWAFSPDTAQPINVDLYRNGVPQRRVLANGSRPDVPSIYPGFGSNHGYDVTIPGSGGTLCAYAIAPAGGVNPQLGCRTVANTPSGVLDAVTVTPQGLRVTGWAISPGTTQPVNVDLYLDGIGQVRIAANVARADIGAAFPQNGANHGFDVTIPGAAGSLCAYAINPNGGVNPQLGCRTVASTPIGTLDAVTVTPQGIRVAGWALSPATTQPIFVDVYRNGVGRAHVVAGSARADIGAAFPAFGPNHGFDVTIPDPNGTVCAYAINPYGATHRQIGCATR